MKLKLNWDAVGIFSTIICAIHCALLPILLTSLPVFGIDIVNNIVFEWSMIAFAFFIGCYALVHGFRKHHKNFTPIAILIIGVTFLLLKQIFHGQRVEYWFLSFAVLLIIIAHYYNYKLCHQGKCSSPHHKH